MAWHGKVLEFGRVRMITKCPNDDFPKFILSRSCLHCKTLCSFNVEHYVDTMQSMTKILYQTLYLCQFVLIYYFFFPV